MEPVSIKFDERSLKNIGKIMQKFGYSTKTEFIREAVRDKIKDLEKEEALKKIDKLFGASKRRTTDAQLHEAGEKAFEELAKKHRIK